MFKTMRCEELIYKIIDAFYEAYNTLGPGLKEESYHSSLNRELILKEIPFIENRQLTVIAKNGEVETYLPDYIVDEKALVEIRPLLATTNICETKLYYCLKSGLYKLGFLVNFDLKRLDIQHIVYEEIETLQRFAPEKAALRKSSKEG